MTNPGKIGKKTISALETILKKVYRGEKTRAHFGPPCPGEKEIYVYAPLKEGWNMRVQYYPPERKCPTPLYRAHIGFPELHPRTLPFRTTPDLFFYHLPMHLKDNHGYAWHSSEPDTGKYIDNNHTGLHVAYNSLKGFREELPLVLGLVRSAALRFNELTTVRDLQFNEAINSILYNDNEKKKR